MIRLTKLNGEEVFLNYFQILYIRRIPETKVKLANGDFYLVRDSNLRFRILHHTKAAKTERLYRYMDELKDVAIAVAEKVILVSLRSSGEVIRRMILKEAERIKKTAWLKIHIDRLDYEMLVETDGDVANELSQISDNIKFVIVEKEEPGKLILETPDEIVDASIDTQMENLRERLGRLDAQESE